MSSDVRKRIEMALETHRLENATIWSGAQGADVFLHERGICSCGWRNLFPETDFYFRQHLAEQIERALYPGAT